MAQIGISIEPLEQLRLQTPELSGCPLTSSPGEPGNQLVPVGSLAGGGGCNTFAQFVTKTAEHLFNYVASFARPMPLSATGEQFVPLSAVQQWFHSYSRRLQMNPNFWKD